MTVERAFLLLCNSFRGECILSLTVIINPRTGSKPSGGTRARKPLLSLNAHENSKESKLWRHAQIWKAQDANGRSGAPSNGRRVQSAINPRRKPESDKYDVMYKIV